MMATTTCGYERVAHPRPVDEGNKGTALLSQAWNPMACVFSIVTSIGYAVSLFAVVD